MQLFRALGLTGADLARDRALFLSFQRRLIWEQAEAELQALQATWEASWEASWEAEDGQAGRSSSTSCGIVPEQGSGGSGTGSDGGGGSGVDGRGGGGGSCGKEVVCLHDRCVIDPLAYTCWEFGGSSSGDGSDDGDCSALCPEVRAMLQTWAASRRGGPAAHMPCLSPFRVHTG